MRLIFYFIFLIGTLCGSVYTMGAQSLFVHILSPKQMLMSFCERQHHTEDPPLPHWAHSHISDVQRHCTRRNLASRFRA